MWTPDGVAALGVASMAAPAWLAAGEPVADSLRAAGPLMAAAGFVGLFAVTHPVRWLALPPRCG